MTTLKITLESNQFEGTKVGYFNGNIKDFKVPAGINNTEVLSIVKVEEVPFKEEIPMNTFADGLDYISFPENPPVDTDEKEWNEFYEKTTGNSLPNNI